MKKIIVSVLIVFAMVKGVGIAFNAVNNEKESFEGIQKEVVENAKRNSIHDDMIDNIERAVEENLNNEKIIKMLREELEMYSKRSERTDVLSKTAAGLKENLVKAIYEIDYDGYISNMELNQIIVDADIETLIYNTLYDKVEDLMEGTNRKNRKVKYAGDIDFGVGEANKEFLEAIEEFDANNPNSLYSDDIDMSVSLNEATKLFKSYVAENYGDTFSFEELSGGAMENIRHAEVIVISGNGNVKKVALLEMDLNNGDIKVIKTY